MVNYGLKDRVAIITGANNPWGIGATTALAFAREGAKVVLVYKKVFRPFDASKMDRNGVDRYYGANAGNADAVESKLKEMGADYIILESDISTDASQIFAGQITYGASKATLEALTRSIALEVAQYGITVNCVSPGPTQTGWIDDEFEKVVVPLIPMGKLIQPEDIAETVLFLASEQARMITGQVIKVSGGKAL